MANQDWTNIGDEIKNIVQSAVDSHDFRQLNQSIRNTINNTMDNVNHEINYGMGQASNKLNKSINDAVSKINQVSDSFGQNDYNKNNTTNQNKNYNYEVAYPVNRQLYANTQGRKVAGYALSIVGGIFTGGIIAASLTLFFISLLTGGFFFGIKIAYGVMLPFFIGCSFMAVKGGQILGRIKRFNFYTRYLRGRSYCTLKELSDAINKSQRYVAKDLKSMISRNMFLQGHIDKQKTCFMVTDEAYNLYIQTQKQLEIRQREEAKMLKETSRNKRAEVREEVRTEETKKAEVHKYDKKLPEEVKQVISEGNIYINQLKEINDAIPSIEISEKISRLELITSKILKQVELHPELIGELSKFIEYYLPTTMKLLRAYEELDKLPANGENISATKREIEDTLDTINQAFENLLDSFFQEKALDISSDISVLQTMLAQEGLTGHRFLKK